MTRRAVVVSRWRRSTPVLAQSVGTAQRLGPEPLVGVLDVLLHPLHFWEQETGRHLVSVARMLLGWLQRSGRLCVQDKGQGVAVDCPWVQSQSQLAGRKPTGTQRAPSPSHFLCSSVSLPNLDSL